MKKTLAFLLALCLCVGLCACGQSTESTDVSIQKDDAIKIDNSTIYSLLNVKIYSVKEDYHLHTFFEIYPIKGGTFSNTKFTLKLILNEGCSVESIPSEKYTSEENNKYDYVYIDITLSADGYYQFDGLFDYFYGGTEDPIKTWSFENVSGTFVPANG